MLKYLKYKNKNFDMKKLLGLIVSLFAWILLVPICLPQTSIQTTTSNVTVSAYISISLSTPLASGVQFGQLNPGTSDNPSTTCQNYACNITVSSDTNVNVDIVLKANAPLTRQGGTETIPNSGYTWNSTDGTTMPSLPGYELSTSYDYTNKVGSNLAPGELRTWQAWLDIPSGQIAGNYNNTLYFCGQQTGTTDCG